MTTQDDWFIWAKIFLTGGPLFTGFLGIIYSLYIKHKHLDEIIKALQNSRYIYLWESDLRNQGWIPTVFSIAKICSMIMIPTPYIKAGELNEADYKNFPPHLKSILKLKTVILFGSGIWLGIIYIILKTS